MHSQLVVMALAASASANLFPAHVPIRRDFLVARQTDAASPTGSSDDQCAASLLSIASTLPDPGNDLLDWEETQTDADPCGATDVPPSLTSQYTSYTDAVLSWYSASSSEVFAALSSCPQYADAALSQVNVCTSGLGAAATGSSGANASATGSGSSGSSAATASASSGASGTATSSGSSDSTSSATGSASSSAETAGAPMREAGVVGAVLAGVLGLAIAL
ncbi:hypothetical protein Daus18300_008332 [Diaporthe australafricana]|uniref:DUF7735 domain-containing protein n=1 Tax=Diaporthe australafricana TaxID=127596 RepID=A0ABR3WJ12_9PEZI